MAIYSLEDLRKSAPDPLKNASDTELIDAYSRNVGADPREIAKFFNLPTGESRSAFTAGIASGVDQLQGLGYSTLGGVSRAIGIDTAADWANKQADLQQVESYLAGKPELERVEDVSLETAPAFVAYQFGKQIPTLATIIASQAIPGGGQIAASTGLARLGATAPRVLGGGGLEAGGTFAARRAALARGEAAATDLLKGATTGSAFGYGSLYQESREAGDESPYLSALGAIPYGLAEAVVPTAVRGSLLRGGTGFVGGMPTRIAKASGTAAIGETGTELAQNELEMLMRGDLTEEEIASRRLNAAVVGGLVGGGFGALGGIRRGEAPGALLQGSNDSLVGQESPSGQAINDAINSATSAQPTASGMLDQILSASAEQEAAREAQINAALQGAQGEAQSTTGVPTQTTTGLPVTQGTAAAPVTPGAPQPTAQPTPSGQQAAQITAEQQSATVQAYGINQAAGTPIPTWEVAGQPLYGAPTVQRFVNDLMQLNAAKSPERVALEAAVVKAGLIKLNKADAKSLVNITNKFLEKYQLGQIQTVAEAGIIINDQIRRLGQDGKGVTDKNVDSLARLYDVVIGQESPAYTQIAEGATNEQAATGLGAVSEQAGTDGTVSQAGRTDAGQVQSLITGGIAGGSPSVQNVPTGTGGARSSAPVATAGRVVGDGGAVPSQVADQGEVSGQAPTTPTTQPAQAVQAQPVPTDQPAGVIAGAQEVGRQAWEDMDASGIAYTSLTEKDRADWDAAVAEGRVTGEMQEQLANEYQIAAEEGFAQQLLDRVINRVIKSPNKARYFSTFLAAGANQQELINKAEENAERNPDGTLTDKAKKYVASLRQNLSALRGVPNAELAAEYGVKLDTLKEWNQELRTFLTDKADKIQQAFKVVAVEMRIGGTDVRMMLESLAARSQQAQTDLVTTIQPDNVVIDQRDLTGWAASAQEGTGMKAQDRTAASVQEVFNASETINARFLRLQEQLVEAENEGNQELADEINAELERLTEEGLKQAKKQTSKRPVKETKEKPSAVPKRETKKVPVGERAPSGQEVGQRDTQKQEVAREGKAQRQEVIVAPQVSGVTVTPTKQDAQFANLPTEFFKLEGFGASVVISHRTDKNKTVWAVSAFRAKEPGKGAGSQLMNALTNWADKNGATLTVTAAADKTEKQQTLVNFYERVGFEPTAESKERAAEGLSYQALIRYPQEVALTTQETAEATWNELRSSMPAPIQEQIPMWNALTETQKKRVAAVGAELNMRNVEQVMALADTSRTIDVEAREIPNNERLLLTNQLKKLPSGQVATLEKHYGVKAGTDEFLTKLSTDIANYVNKGAEAVAAVIRGIIKSLSEGVVAFGLVFNPAVQYDAFTYDIEALYKKAEGVTLSVPVDAKEKMSPLAQAVYRDMAAAAKESGKGFMIADKQAGMIHVFNPDGSLLVQDAALFGKDTGDTLSDLSSLQGGKKITPAGKYALEAVKLENDKDYAGGYTLDLVGTNDGTGSIAIHAAYLGNLKDKRLERLASPDAKDNRVSYGCINTTHDMFLNKLKPNIAKFDGGMIFVLPEEVKNIQAMQERKPFSVQRLNFRALGNEVGVESAMRSFRGLGIDPIVDMVDEFQVLPEDSDADGQYDVVDGKIILAFKISALDEGTRYSSHVVRHEFGHVVDEAAKGGIYSSQPQMSVIVKDGKVIPVGAVAKEVFDLYKSNELWNEFMAYPFERSDYDAQRMQAEMFAQLWSIFTDPVMRQEYMSVAPIASAYMNEVIKHVQKSTSQLRQKEETAPQGQAEKLALRIKASRNGQTKGPVKQTTRVTKRAYAVMRPSATKAFMEGLSPEAINDRIDQFPKIVRGPMRATNTGLRGWWRKGLNYIAFTQAVINRAVKEGIPSAAKFGRLLQERGSLANALEREVEGIADMYANVPDNERGIGDGSVNDFIFESTRQKKWGFQPSWTSTQVVVDPKMKTAFDKLSPESKAFIQAVFKHGDDMLALKKATVLSYTSSEYDNLILEAANAGDTLEAAKLRKQKADELERFKGLFAIREGLPYAPIKRTGNYVVVAKSAEYREADRVGDTKKVAELEKDPDHYHVSFVDGEIEAQRLQTQLLEQGHFGKDPDSVFYSQRENEAVRNQLYGGNNFLLSVTRLRSQIDAKGDNVTDASSIAAFNQMRKIVTDMYLESLAEASARKSEIRRRGVSGEVDMLNSFTLQGRADANFISAIQYGERIQDSIAAMRKEAKLPGNRNAKSELYNELIARYTKTLEFEPAPVTQKLTRLTSIWFLATSPGYYLQNLTQPYMMSLPLMAARHDVGRASGELYKAYKDLKEVIKSAKVGQQFDFSKVPADVRDAIQELVVRSRIDIGLNTEMGEFKVEGQGFFTDRWNRVDKFLRLAVQKVESVNRLSTAIAAYRLEFERTKDKNAALEYADQILTDTHGDYTAWAAPRAFNTNIGKVALQFRKFQLIQLSYLAKLVNESLTGKDKAVARKALAYTLGNTAIMTGVVGMPGYAAISWALGALFGDEDEPYNLEMTLREYIGDETVANVILRGAPTLGGVDLSGKIGMGNMLSIMPFTEIDKLDGQKTYEIIGTLLGGPAGGLVARAADGMAYIGNGDYWKGLEMMTPKGMGDLMKAIRVSGEGVTNRRGDVLLGPDDLGELDTFWRSIGLAPVKQTVRSVKQSAKFELEQNFDSRTSRIKNDYVKAYKSRDTQKMAEARRAWAELQEARRRNGYKIQPLSNLLKAPVEQSKRERQTKGGLQYDAGSRNYVQQVAEI